MYHAPLEVDWHQFTTSPVQPIDPTGANVKTPDGQAGPLALPSTAIYGFNGKFPGG